MFAPMPHGGPPTSTQAAANSVAAVFGGPLQQQPPEGQRGGQQSAPFNPAAASAAHQLPGGITQGQQPILNVSSIAIQLPLRRDVVIGGVPTTLRTSQPPAKFAFASW